MDILDDIEIVDVPKKAQEIREAKLAEIDEKIKETETLMFNKPSDDEVTERSYLRIIHWWTKKKELILNA